MEEEEDDSFAALDEADSLAPLMRDEVDKDESVGALRASKSASRDRLRLSIASVMAATPLSARTWCDAYCDL